MLGRISLLIIILTYIATSETKSTDFNQRIKCYQKNFNERIQCINNHRVKRQSNCNSNIPCTNNLNTITPSPFVKPKLDKCLQTCITTCTGDNCSNTCEINCQIPLTEKIDSNIQPLLLTPQPLIRQEDSNQPPQYYHPAPNVITIIRLTNIVNSTNVVNVTTTLNNTNLNNIDIGSNASSNILEQNEKCCYVVRPKVCQNIIGSDQKPMVRCVHRQHRTCGKICASQTVHAQVRQPCTGPPSSCPPSIAYIPQPTPRCVYHQHWPYITCGNFANSNCQGCYDHYGYGFQSYHQNTPPECVGCFDDGFNSGSLYRQGPYYRPGYYHIPPVYLGEANQLVQQNCGSGGCIGNELIDPVFGASSYSPYSTYSYYQQIPAPSYIQQPQISLPVQNETLSFDSVEAWENYLNKISNKTTYIYPPISSLNTPQYMQGFTQLPTSYPMIPFLRFPVNETVLIKK